MKFCLAVLLTLCANLAHADMWADYYAALDQFSVMLLVAQKNNTLPDMKDEKVAAVLSVLTDSQRFLMPLAVPFDNVDELTEFCDHARRIYVLYVFAGTKIGDTPNDGQDAKDDRIAKQITENTVKYQDALAKLYPFVLRCMVGLVPITTKFVLNLKPEEMTVVRLQGLQQARKGYAQMYVGTLQMLGTPGLKESVRARFAHGLADIAPTSASTLTLAFRQQLLTFVRNHQAVFDGNLRADFDTIVQALEDTHCEGLCKF